MFSYQSVKYYVAIVGSAFKTPIDSDKLFTDFDEFRKACISYYNGHDDIGELMGDFNHSEKVMKSRNIFGICCRDVKDGLIIRKPILYINPNRRNVHELLETIIHEFCHIKYPRLHDGVEFERYVYNEFCKIVL